MSYFGASTHYSEMHGENETEHDDADECDNTMAQQSCNHGKVIASSGYTNVCRSQHAQAMALVQTRVFKYQSFPCGESRAHV
jgi:hypothetical protein